MSRITWGILWTVMVAALAYIAITPPVPGDPNYQSEPAEKAHSTWP